MELRNLGGAQQSLLINALVVPTQPSKLRSPVVSYWRALGPILPESWALDLRWCQRTYPQGTTSPLSCRPGFPLSSRLCGLPLPQGSGPTSPASPLLPLLVQRKWALKARSTQEELSLDNLEAAAHLCWLASHSPAWGLAFSCSFFALLPDLPARATENIHWNWPFWSDYWESYRFCLDPG